MSDFIISGFTECTVPPLAAPGVADVRRAELAQLAYVALSKFEFGAIDVRQHKPTLAAHGILAARQRCGELSHTRAKQRTHAYSPAPGREHCPHCWVFEGVKRPLQFASHGPVETASCTGCDEQFQLLKMA